ncbi:hypothetical protein EGW08_008213, partial [Elysia chlorotica]
NDLSKSRAKQEETSSSRQLPQWIVIWFYASAAICTWDASFIMCRPYSMPGKSLAWIWAPCKFSSVAIFSEAIMKSTIFQPCSFAFMLHILLNSQLPINIHYRRSKHTVPTAFMVNVMTMWKTVLYFLMFTDLCTGGQYRHGNTLIQEIFIMVIPNIIWIFLPTIAMIQLWGYILPSEEAASRQSFASNGEAKSLELSSSAGPQQAGKREVLRGPGSGLVQGGNVGSLPLSSCMRQRVVSNGNNNKEQI